MTPAAKSNAPSDTSRVEMKRRQALLSGIAPTSASAGPTLSGASAPCSAHSRIWRRDTLEGPHHRRGVDTGERGPFHEALPVVERIRVFAGKHEIAHRFAF